ncbi:FecR family protein [Sphingobacterium bovistauri]|uniref:FecR family protein n=1 Tax=Sphingobacterium bovistauri TaxID=2781959 RepID=A0ABS7Z8Q2_9SPHI|nr:FecR family protein [Sphingobacterium bovistauri]MCA5005069.1 FecR family protein [Sphingobacterium bovistauri]
MQTERIQLLFQKYYSKSITEIEREELFSTIHTLKDDQLENILKENFDNHFDFEWVRYEMDDGKLWGKIVESTDIVSKKDNLRWLKRFAVAASVISLLSFGIYKFYYDSNSITTNKLSKVVYDILPGGNKAILTLANGKKVYLDTLSLGNSIVDGNTIITKLEDGKIVYETSSSAMSSKSHNIVETPKGGMFQVSLPDGSEVWLNAMSKIKYPINFDKGNRIIDLEGEAYFEIAKDKNRPFIVNLGQGKSVNVLGTHFNTKSYNLQEMSTTVLEGAVGVYGYDVSRVVKPNKKFEVSSNHTRIIDDVDVNQIMSWKNGYFSQGEISLTELLSEISRWYDVKIENDENIDMDIIINVKRDNTLQNLIKILELTKELKFELSNKTLKVMSMKKK